MVQEARPRPAHNITPIPMAVSQEITDVPSQIRMYICTSLQGLYLSHRPKIRSTNMNNIKFAQ